MLETALQSTYFSLLAPHDRLRVGPTLAWDRAVSVLCKAGRQGLVEPILWLESLLMGPIKHAPNGCQSQGADMCTHSFMT